VLGGGLAWWVLARAVFKSAAAALTWSLRDWAVAACALRLLSACTRSWSEATPCFASSIILRLSLSVRCSMASACNNWARTDCSLDCAFTTLLEVEPWVAVLVACVAETCERRLSIMAAAARASASSSEGSSMAIRSPCLTCVPSSTSSLAIRPCIWGLTMIWLESTVPISTKSLERGVETK